ncbi:hypothetical protein [Aquamicrobium sp.]|uniref:hypothetical protein n=1 Tax=Aquamicrobium sp. TaxID=1872579 RepID=UPI002586B9FB|nr:hypothetical protein [Aquamicrobium sp.]MCK9549166.1 hypothetical protein [Aquamicrobium sp.]
MSETPNIGHYHEALDRAHTINVMIEELLVDHPAIAAHKDLLEALDELQENGANLYQAIGVYFHTTEAPNE